MKDADRADRTDASKAPVDADTTDDTSELAKAIDAAMATIDSSLVAGGPAAAPVIPVVPVVSTTPMITTPPLVAADGAAIDPALAQVATQVTAAATTVAAGAPVDPSKPGVAELLSSVSSGETSVDDLPKDVQELVAKATAAQAATPPSTAPADGPTVPPQAGAATATPVVATPVVATTPVAATPAAATPAAATPATATPTASAVTPASSADAASVAAAAAETDAPSASAAPMSPLAVAIQAAASAAAGGGTQDGGQQPQGQQPDGGTQVQPIGQTSPAAQAADAPVDAAPVAAPTSIISGQATSPVQSTAAAPATPSISVANPGQQAAAIEALVHLSRSSGKSQARIALAPEQLGGIQVTLIFGADGVTARMIADRPEAAAALNRAGQDLKDALQQQGIDLAGLETGFAGDGQRGGSREAASSEASRLAAAARTSRQSDGEQTLHVALHEQPAPQPLAPGRTIDLRA